MRTMMQWLDTGRRFLGPPGLAGLVLLAAAPLFWLLVVQPEAGTAHARNAQLSVAMAHSPVRSGAVEVPDQASELERFYAQFPRAGELSGIIEKIHVLARESGVTLRLGEYKLDRSGTDRLWRYEILLPVEAGYPEMRRFIDAVGREVVTLGLKEVTFKREEAGDKAVKTQLKFVLFMRGHA